MVAVRGRFASGCFILLKKGNRMLCRTLPRLSRRRTPRVFRTRQAATGAVLTVMLGTGCVQAQDTNTLPTNAAMNRVQAPLSLRPPSVPLVAHDPYFSVWSPSETLSAANTQHWTNSPQPISSLIRIDGQTFRLLGAEPSTIAALEQKSLQVLPTRTIATFGNAQVLVTLTFLTPALPDDLDVLSRPLTYVTWEARSVDGKEHSVQAYFDASAMLAVNEASQKVIGGALSTGRGANDVQAVQISSLDQPVLAKKGDNLRIDWGHLLVSATGRSSQSFAPRALAVNGFAQLGVVLPLPTFKDSTVRVAGEGAPVAAVAVDLGRVSTRPVMRMAMIGYDDEYSITLMGRKLRPYWRRNGAQTADLLRAAARDFPSLQKRCVAFDTELMDDLRRSGGEKYARLAALSYRQTLAGNKVVADAKGAPLCFLKENFSNGCIATVDLHYPMLPQFLLLSPILAKASLVPVLNYAASERWKWPFAPHDMGTYPIANGQVYGGGERTEENQMPVEESGNLLILMAAIAKTDGNANFAARWWPQLSTWAKYLEARGFDPENQLSTDDFAGHLAHNTNLSIKAIEGLASYALLCDMRGDKAEATRIRNEARAMAARWVTTADDGDHFRLAFDRAGTWSQKYNMVWDKLLGFNLFPQSVVDKELAFYRTKLNRYGLPLDSRENYTKLDWSVWTATMNPTREGFEQMISPTYDFANATPDRNPLTDWYRTTEPKQVGFQARPVVGGVFIKMLDDNAMWQKWARRDKLNQRLKGSDWAAQPLAPIVTAVIPTSQEVAQTWSYTFDKPAANWFATNYDASSWKTGPGGFGTAGTPGATVRTTWDTGDIWLRRDFDIRADQLPGLQLLMHHDEDAEVYINGVLAVSAGGFSGSYDPFVLSAQGRAALKAGRNTIAVHVHQTGGGQYIDLGFARVQLRE